jgi:hypothetical protein
MLYQGLDHQPLAWVRSLRGTRGALEPWFGGREQEGTHDGVHGFDGNESPNAVSSAPSTC